MALEEVEMRVSTLEEVDALGDHLVDSLENGTMVDGVWRGSEHRVLEAMHGGSHWRLNVVAVAKFLGGLALFQASCTNPAFTLAALASLVGNAAKLVPAGLSAFREKLTPLEFLTAVSLGQFDCGVHAEVLKQGLIESVGHLQLHEIGVDEDYVLSALENLNDAAIDTALKGLLKAKLVACDGTRWTLTDRHFEWA